MHSYLYPYTCSCIHTPTPTHSAMHPLSIQPCTQPMHPYTHAHTHPYTQSRSYAYIRPCTHAYTHVYAHTSTHTRAPTDSHCATGLKCMQRNNMEPVPGCNSGGVKGHDYCYDPKSMTLLNLGVSAHTLGSLHNCQGDCDSDANCMKGLLCYQRNANEAVPGCTPGGAGDKSGYDYCYVPPAKCTDIVGCAVAETCRTTTTQQCAKCKTGYKLDNGAADSCQLIGEASRR